MPIFIFQQECTDTRMCTIKAATKEKALAKFNDQDSYEKLDWSEQSPESTELVWVGEQSPDGVTVKREWQMESEQFPEEES